jgi:hypothetical protein
VRNQNLAKTTATSRDFESRKPGCLVWGSKRKLASAASLSEAGEKFKPAFISSSNVFAKCADFKLALRKSFFTRSKSSLLPGKS